MHAKRLIILFLLLAVLTGTINAQGNPVPELELAQIISPGAVNAIRWSADRSQLITARPGGLYVNAVDNLRQPTAFYRLLQNSRRMDVSPDNERIIYMNDESEVRLFDGFNNRRLLTDPDISAVALGPDNRIAVADQFSLFLWPAGEGQQLTAYGRNDSLSPNLMTFSPGGSLIAYAGCIQISMGDCVRGAFYMYETDTGREVLSGEVDTEITLLAFSDNGQQLYINSLTDAFQDTPGSFDVSIAVYDTTTRTLLTEFVPGAGNGLVTGDLSGETLAFVTRTERGIQLLDLGTSTIRDTFIVSDERPNEIRFSPDGALLAVADDTGIYVLDAQTGEIVRSNSGHSDLIADLTFSMDNTRLATASWDDSVRVWDVETGNQQQLLTFDGVFSDMSAVAFTADGNLFTAGTDLTIWDGDAIITNVDNSVHSATYNAARDVYATGTALGKVELWDSDLTLTDDFQGPQTFIRSLDFSEDGTMLAFCINDVVNVRDQIEERIVDTFTVESPFDCQEVAISPDGRFVAAGVQVYDRETRESRFFGDPEADSTAEVTFNHNGTVLATSESSGRIRLWDVRTLNLIAETQRQHNVRSLDFNSDGSLLVSGDGDGSIMIWRVP